MIQSLERAFRILRLLDELEEPESGMGAQEIALRSGLKFPTAHNFIKSLVSLGYAEQLPGTGKYRVSAALARLGSGGGRLKTLERIAEPFAAAAAAELGETVVVVAERKLKRVLLCAAESTQALRVSLPHKEDSLTWDKATTRIIAGAMGAEKLSALVALIGLPGKAWDGIATEAALGGALDAVRRNRRVVADDADAGISSFAVPIEDAQGLVHASIGAYLPRHRCSPEKEHIIFRVLEKKARDIEKALSSTNG